MRKFETLKKSLDFKKTFDEGRTYVNKYFVLHVRSLSKEKGNLKMAFCVGKKLGTAVRRNRIKRQIRHAFLTLEPQILRGFAVIIIGRYPTRGAGFSMLCNSLKELFVRARMLNV